jgi:hypothetical protein
MSRSARRRDAVALEPVEHAFQAFFCRALPYRRINCDPATSRGTEGSNPSPSTGESIANLTSSIMVGADTLNVV